MHKVLNRIAIGKRQTVNCHVVPAEADDVLKHHQVFSKASPRVKH